MNMRCLAGLLCFLACAAPAAPWFTRVWRTDDGLPNDRVDALLQGRDGFLWVATPEALARFDGIRFEKVSFANAGAGEYMGARAMAEGQDGSLWIAPTRRPVVRLAADLSSGELPRAGLPTGRVAAMAEDGEGALWLAYSGGLCRVKNNQTTRPAGPEGVPAGAVFENGLATDASGRVWLAKGYRVGFFQDGRFEQRANFNVGKPRLAAARDHGVWIASGVRLYRCDPQGGLTDLGAFQPDTLHSWARVVLEDHTGAVWIGTDSSGLYRYGTTGFEKIETSHPAISSLAEDREGNLWVGTAGGGLDRITRGGAQLEGFDNGSALVGIQSICEDARGAFWGATQNGALVFLVGGKWAPALTNAAWTEFVTTVAADRAGTVWIGTRDRKLYAWRNHELASWTPADGLASHTIVAMLPASNGDLWIGEYGNPQALQCLREGKLRTLAWDGKPASMGRITSLAQDAAGQIWVATASGLLLRAQGDHLLNESSLLRSSGRAILCLAATGDGALWIGFEGRGLGRLKNERYSRIGTEQGLYDDDISQIVDDEQGCLWFGSEHGIFKVHRRELESVMEGQAAHLRSIHYGRNVGLSSMEADSANVEPFVSPNALRSRDGRLWIPMRTALAALDPDILREDPQPPPVLLTRATLDGQPAAMPALLRLPPGHRHLEFEFTAIHLSAPEEVHFRYRLANFDNDWVEKDTQRSASYSRLTAGRYRFEVEAAAGDGPWSRTPTSVALVVLPFFWQTWWFEALSAAALILAVVLIVRYVSFRRLRLKLLALEQQTALDRERSRIAKDLHDDLGGSLTEVGLLVKRLHQHQQDSKKVEVSVRQISSTVRRVNESLDDIVWAINPRNDTLSDLIGHLGQSAVDFLRLAGLQCEVDLPASVPPCVLTPEQRHNLYLAAREAVHNVVRHARASQVRFKIEAAQGDLNILVEDNGCGFNGAPPRPGAEGLRNMRQRMKEIGGQCRIEAAPGKGTRVSFSFPLPTGRRQT